jgi:TonB family protein
MREGVSDVIVARTRQLDRYSRPLTASFAVHVGLIVVLAVLPSAWLKGEPPPKLMTISLTPGATGPEVNGMSALAGRRVDTVTPPTKRPEPIPTAAAKSNAVVEPIKTEAKTPPKPTTTAPPAPAPPKPLTGTQVTQGNAIAETTAKGINAGLSTGGAGGTSANLDFCCQAFIQEMKVRVDERWNPTPGATREAIVEFAIERDGSISKVELTQSSGNTAFDLAAKRSVLNVRLSPLPAAFTEPRLMIRLRFPASR